MTTWIRLLTVTCFFTILSTPHDSNAQDYTNLNMSIDSIRSPSYIAPTNPNDDYYKHALAIRRQLAESIDRQRHLAQTQRLTQDETRKAEQTQQKLTGLLLDALYQDAIANNRVYNATTHRSAGPASCGATLLNTGNLLVYKPINQALWCSVFGDTGIGADGWCHANMFSGWDTTLPGSPINIIEAPGRGKNSRIVTWDTFAGENPYSTTFSQVLLVDFTFNYSERDSMIAYHNQHQADKPYPNVLALPFSKYSTDTFYCSSLVWRAHESSGRFMDLDDQTSPLVVWPVELVNSHFSRDHYCAVVW